MTVRFKEHSFWEKVAIIPILSAYLLHYLYILFMGYIKIFPDSDSEFYWRWSLDIWLGRAEIPFIGVPGYPFFLALSRVLFPTVELQVFLNHLLTALAGVLLYFTVAELTGKRWAVASMLLFLLYTPFMMYASILTPEPLALFLFGLGLFLAVRTPLASLKAFLLGLVLGAASVVRPALLMFGLALGFYLFFIKGFSKGWKGLLGYYIGLLLFPVGVVLSNGIEGGFWGISTHAGINFYVGNSPYSTGTFYSGLPFRPTQAGFIEDARIVASKMVGKALTDAQACRYWLEKASEYIVNNPLDWLKLMIKKLLLLYNRQEYHDANWASMHIPVLPFLDFGFIFPFSLLALWTTRRNKLVGILRLALVLTSLATILVFINTRYKLMVVFPAIGLAVLGMRDLVCVLTRRDYRTALIYSSVLLALFALSRVQLVRISPSSTAIRFNRAMELFERGDISAAERLFKDILRDNPRDYLSWFALGNVYFSRGDFRRAMRCYQRSHELNRLFADAVFNYGVCAMELGKYGSSYQAFSQLYRVSPHKPDVVLNLVYSMAKLGKCKEAKELLGHFLSTTKVKILDDDLKEIKEELERCPKDT